MEMIIIIVLAIPVLCVAFLALYLASILLLFSVGLFFCVLWLLLAMAYSVHYLVYAASKLFSYNLQPPVSQHYLLENVLDIALDGLTLGSYSEQSSTDSDNVLYLLAAGIGLGLLLS